MHLGEQVNVFRHGSLGMQQQQNELFTNHFNGSILGGTVNGSIILFVGISTAMYKILNELQQRLSKFLTTVDCSGPEPEDLDGTRNADHRGRGPRRRAAGDPLQTAAASDQRHCGSRDRK